MKRCLIALLVNMGMLVRGLGGPAFARRPPRWYRTVDMGYHVLNKRPETRLDAERRSRVFPTHGFDAQAWLKLTNIKLAQAIGRGRAAVEHDHALRQVRRRFWPLHLAAEAVQPKFRVLEFSKKEVVVAIRIDVSARRWHRFSYELRRYRLRRDQQLDASLSLPALERQLSFTYRGLGHGVRLDQKTIDRLGPFDRYPGQSPSLQELYFKRHGLYVNVRHGVIYYVERRARQQ